MWETRYHREIHHPEPLKTNFKETWMKKKSFMKMTSEKCRPFCSGLNVFIVFIYFFRHPNWWSLSFTLQTLFFRCLQTHSLVLQLFISSGGWYHIKQDVFWEYHCLTHCGLVIWINIGSGNGLLPDGTKPLPELMLTYHQWGVVAFAAKGNSTWNAPDTYPWYAFEND